MKEREFQVKLKNDKLSVINNANVLYSKERYVEAFESVVNGVIIVKEELQRFSDQRERTD